jgi:hypothetical protein
MPNDNIDKQCQVNLPSSDNNVFVQLVESRPERVEYRIDLVDPQQNINHVVPKDKYQIPVLHDLKRSANASRGYKMVCAGFVSFSVSGSWDLECRVMVDNNVAGKCSGTLNGTQGTTNMFRFFCEFV